MEIRTVALGGLYPVFVIDMRAESGYTMYHHNYYGTIAVSYYLGRDNRNRYVYEITTSTSDNPRLRQITTGVLAYIGMTQHPNEKIKYITREANIANLIPTIEIPEQFD